MKWLLIFISLTLAACSPSPDEIAQDYLERIARVTAENLPDDPSFINNPPPLTQVKQQSYLIESGKVSLLDFLKLQSCELAQSLGYKNSQLGKLAPASQKMHLERDFLLQAPACIKALQSSNPELVQLLSQALQQKRQQALKIWWNAWFAAAEWQSYISGSRESLEQGGASPGHLRPGLVALDYAIDQGLNWQQQNYAYSDSDMEQQLQQLHLAESLSRWRNSLRVMTLSLYRVASMLEQSQQKKTLCSDGVEKKQAEYLRNVFNQFYVAQIQPYLGRIYNFGNELWPRLNAVKSLAKELNSEQTAHPLFLLWYESLKLEKQQFEQMNLRHVKAWQTLLEECGQSPGRNDAK